MKVFPLILSFLSLSLVFSKPDPNFYVFLCFGQSNMQGQGEIEEQDKIVPDRFQVLAAVNFGWDPIRTKYNWYKATPPLCRPGTGISPADYFGRHMVENLPEKIKIGVINVSIGGCKIELFDESTMQSIIEKETSEWFFDAMAAYDNNPFRALINLGKKAQESGVIKGILMHQGEANTGEIEWLDKVKRVYQNILKELDLKQEEVPLLAGEVVSEDMNGVCAYHNKVIKYLPYVISNCHVISAKGLTPQSDLCHFTTEGYRQFGIRYAEKMLTLLPKESNGVLTAVVVILCLIIVAVLGFVIYRRFIKKKDITIGNYTILKK